MQAIVGLANMSIGHGQPVFIIAEAGVNHNGDMRLARRLVHEAKRVGANCVKFQTFKAERVVLDKAPKADYQLLSTDPSESQLDMLKKLELSEEHYVELIRLCREEGIVFLSTPYNVEDIDFLESLDVSAFKIASGQAVEPHFLECVANKGKPVLLSTGMCTLAEVDEAVRVIRESGNEQLVVLQCTTNYPSSIEDCNLRAMFTMGDACDVLVGYSDHTQTLTAAMVAVALGACVIERHLTLDKNLPGPDHSTSSEPEEFARFVRKIREAELCLGSKIKHPTESEKRNSIGMRRSVVSKRDIVAGTPLSWENLTLRRPCTGISGKHAQLLIGRKASRDIPANTVLTVDMIQ